MSIWLRLTIMLLLVLSVACATNGALPEEAGKTAVWPTTVPEPTETAVTETPLRTIAYVARAIVPEITPYERLTHINFSFPVPHEAGQDC